MSGQKKGGLTAIQWDALLAASKTGCDGFHLKTVASLQRYGLLKYKAGAFFDYVPTTKGRNLLHERFAAGEIGPRGEAPDA